MRLLKKAASSQVGNFVTLGSLAQGLDTRVRRSPAASSVYRLGLAAKLSGSPAVRGDKGSALLLIAIETAKDGRHLLRVLLLFFVLGPLGVLICSLLRPIAILLLNGETFDVVSIHDLLDALVVVQDGEAWHFIEVGQLLVVAVGTLHVEITGVVESVSLHTCVLECAS